MYLSLNNRFAIGTSNNLYFLGKQDDEKSAYFRAGPLTYEGNVYCTTLRLNICNSKITYMHLHQKIPILILKFQAQFT